MAMDPTLFTLKLGWTGMLLGVVSGAIMGLFFHRENWLGGYGSHTRRFLRLGHISFFGIGLLTLFYGFSLAPLGIAEPTARIGAYAFAIALFGMPLTCTLTAFTKSARHLFPIPVVAATVGILITIFS